MSDDLVARLRHAWDERERQLDEDERVAQAAGRGYEPDDPRISSEEIAHIARHDPARVLAEVERGRRDLAAMRRILDEYEQAQSYYEQHRAAPAGEVTGLWTSVRLLAEAEGLA